MDSRNKIKFYVTPDGTCSMRAFTVKNFKLLDSDGIFMQTGLQQHAEVKE